MKSAACRAIFTVATISLIIFSFDLPATMATDKPDGGFTIDLEKERNSMPEFSLFGSLVDFAREKYQLATNDSARAAIRESRRKYLCEIVNGRTTGEWLGFLQGFGPNSEGFGILSVSIGRDLTLTTKHRTQDDAGHDTLIRPDDPIYITASRMGPLTAVWFSGSFFPGGKDCWETENPTMDSAMAAPDFTFKFRSLRRFDDP
jgi:hypothetical protein